MKRFILALAVAAGGVAGCLPSAPRAAMLSTTVSMPPCAFTSEPVVVREDEGTVLLRWEVEDQEVWYSTQLPADSNYARYRRQLEDIGAVEARPEQFVPEHQRDEPFWARELHNVELAYGGTAGAIRPVQCLDALLFAIQNARVRQLDRPTEFLASVLRKRVGEQSRMRIYFGAGDELFPPKSVYGFDQVERDVADGWDYAVALHNHTFQDAEGWMRLGVPAPSISDIQLLNGLVERLGLDAAWVTNGIYTVEIPAADLGRYLGPE